MYPTLIQKATYGVAGHCFTLILDQLVSVLKFSLVLSQTMPQFDTGSIFLLQSRKVAAVP